MPCSSYAQSGPQPATTHPSPASQPPTHRVVRGEDVADVDGVGVGQQLHGTTEDTARSRRCKPGVRRSERGHHLPTCLHPVCHAPSSSALFSHSVGWPHLVLGKLHEAAPHGKGVVHNRDAAPGGGRGAHRHAAAGDGGRGRAGRSGQLQPLAPGMQAPRCRTAPASPPSSACRARPCSHPSLRRTAHLSSVGLPGPPLPPPAWLLIFMRALTTAVRRMMMKGRCSAWRTQSDTAQVVCRRGRRGGHEGAVQRLAHPG